MQARSHGPCVVSLEDIGSLYEFPQVSLCCVPCMRSVISFLGDQESSFPGSAVGFSSSG